MDSFGEIPFPKWNTKTYVMAYGRICFTDKILLQSAHNHRRSVKDDSGQGLWMIFIEILSGVMANSNSDGFNEFAKSVSRLIGFIVYKIVNGIFTWNFSFIYADHLNDSLHHKECHCITNGHFEQSIALHTTFDVDYFYLDVATAWNMLMGGLQWVDRSCIYS